MPLSIKDPEADDLARKLAHETGETLTDAVKLALQERWERVRQDRSKSGLAERLLKIGRVCSQHVVRPASSLDHGDLLYDEQGLPR